MSGRSCLSNSSSALYRVFVSPNAGLLRIPLRATSQSSTLNHHPQATIQLLPGSQLIPGNQIRCYQRSRKINKERAARAGDLAEARKEISEDKSFDRRYTTKESLLKSGRDRLPRDLEITDPQIMVLENDGLKGPLNTKFVLSKLQPEESLRMIQPYRPGTKEKAAEYALCSIVDKKAEYEREREAKEKKKGVVKVKSKEIEMSWSISGNDLQTKTRQLVAFVQKGLKVEVVLGKKKKGKAVGKDDAVKVLATVREEIEKGGGRESKPSSGEVGEIVRLFVEKK